MDINDFDALYSNYCGYVRGCLDEITGYDKEYAYELVGYGYCLLHMLDDYLPHNPFYKKAILHTINQLEHHFEFEHFGFSSPKQNAESSTYVMEIDYGA